MTDSYKHKGLRKKLVRQIREKGIKRPEILASIEQIPRHWFIDSVFEEHAYQDKAFPIGQEQTISQPFTVAYQTQLLEVQKGDKILEIGTGSGYQACILACLGANVYSIECQPNLHETAKKNIRKTPFFEKIQLFLGDGSQGLKKHAPYDKIIVTASAPQLPAAYLEQLKAPGIVVVPIGDRKRQKMIRFLKKQEEIIKEVYHTFSFVPLKGEYGWK